jgi:demethylmenaquinone methyltransferase/2-methoxy-6-polyprenyl-1,4-benzoquinol methylase
MSGPRPPSPDTAAPDAAVRAQSIARYRRHAPTYDLSCGPTWPIRERAVAWLDLRPGESVLDVACGTGLSLPLLREAVGTTGRIFAFDQSPDMLALARARAERAGWENVHLIEAAAQSLILPEKVDALLLHYTHDIARSPHAIDRLLACARPGARVAIAGIKYFPRWLAPLNLWVYWKNSGYNGAPGELTSPWDKLAPHLADWHLESTQFGMGYLARGRVRG